MSRDNSGPSTFEDETFVTGASTSRERRSKVQLPITIDEMSDRSMTSVADEQSASPVGSISIGQRMLSATTGSLLTSLLVTPLDVVRVRLQAQPQQTGPSALRTSSLHTRANPAIVPDLGVRACCREVFWVSNNAQYCLASTPSVAINHGGAAGAMASPSHSSSFTPETCAVEDARRKTFTSTLDGLRKIARNEGFFTLWRGLSPTLVMAIPANVIYFTGYDYLRYSPTSPIHTYIPDNYAPLAAGSVARVAAAIAVSPIEMFRTRMQANSGSSQTIFMDTFYGLGYVVRSQGYTSLWRGLTLTMWRDVPFSGLYWWGYEAVRNRLTDFREAQRGRAFEGDMREARTRSRSRENRKTTFVDSFIAGATSGAIASMITTPFDVGKTRQQVYVHSKDGALPPMNPSKAAAAAADLLPEERSMPRFLYHILKTEGVAGLFKGWAARCLKVAPACAIMISSYEVSKKMAQSANSRKSD